MHKLTIIAVDPGINLGTAVLEVDVTTKQITVHDAKTNYLDDIIKHYYLEMFEDKGSDITRIIVIEDLIRKYSDCWIPDFYVHETAYLKVFPRFNVVASVESFAKLRENIMGIKLAACRYDASIPIIPINPSTVKYAVIGAKNGDKEQIKAGLLQKPDLDLSKIEIDTLDEHGIDAIAIGYTFIQKKVLGEPNERVEHSKRIKGNKNKATR